MKIRKGEGARYLSGPILYGASGIEYRKESAPDKIACGVSGAGQA